MGSKVVKREERERNRKDEVRASKHLFFFPDSECKRIHGSLAMLQDTKAMKKRSMWFSNDLRKHRILEGVEQTFANKDSDAVKHLLNCSPALRMRYLNLGRKQHEGF